ncbi:MAG: transcriptional repressor [Gammaproteobacteria bacterium]
MRIVSAHSRPVSAYDIVHKMGAQPPTVYRALDFLAAAGLIHKVQNFEGGAGFVACGHPDAGCHSCFLLICDNCGKCTESCARRPDTALRRAAQAAGFLARSLTMEVAGLCSSCRKPEAKAD